MAKEGICAKTQRPNNRGLWRQMAGCNAGTAKACGESAWWKLPLPRGILEVLGVLGFFKAGKRQASTP